MRRNSQVRSGERGRGHAHAHVGQRKTLVGFGKAALRWKGAGQSCLTALRRENCELTAQLGMLPTEAMDRAQTALLRSRRRRANTHRERPYASPTVRGGRLGLPAPFHRSGRQSGHRPEIAKVRRSSLRWTLFRQSSDYPSRLGRSRSVRASVDGVAESCTQFRSHMARDARQGPSRHGPVSCSEVTLRLGPWR